MKEISLTRGFVTLVDNEWYDHLNQWKWQANTAGKSDLVYAVRKGMRIIMHRVIMGAPKGMEVDHIDGNGLNNQCHNLRLATHSQNLQNRRASRSGVSPYRGVSWHNQAHKWQVHIKPPAGKNKNLGYFASEIDAAKAYDKAANEYFGEFARLNFPTTPADITA